MELSASRVRDVVHEIAVQRERQTGNVGGILRIEGHSTDRHRVGIAVDQQFAHGRADVAGPHTYFAPEFALNGKVVLVDVRTFEVRVNSLIAERGEVGDLCTTGKPIAEPTAARGVDEAELVGRQ